MPETPAPETIEHMRTRDVRALGLALAAVPLALMITAQCGGEPPQLDPGQVRIYHDELGLPHVFANTDAGVFRGLGYTQARDFPVATLANLWSASGRFAEVAGRAVLPRDQRMRQWGFDRRARELAEDPDELDDSVRALLWAYVEGVNAGRRWWLADAARLEALLGAEGELAFDPVPPWLHPQVLKDDPLATLQRLFQAEVGLENVLAFGLTLTAGPDFGGAGHAMRTNVWLMRGGEDDPNTRFMADLHQPLQEFGYRSYFVQLAGPGYDVVGYGSPGFPCIASGANRRLAFGSMTLPKKPIELAAAGLPFRIEEGLPRVGSAWSARLKEDLPLRFTRGEESVALTTEQVTLRYWDPRQGELRDDPRGTLNLRWVEDGPDLRLPVVDPAPDQPLEPADRREIRYEGRSFLTQRSIWETWIGLGLSSRVGAGEGGAERVLERESLATGSGQIVLLADVEGGFKFLWGTRVPIQTRAALERGGNMLDGNDPAHRWLGFHGHLPQGLLDTSGGKEPVAWIECNSSPEFLGAGLESWFFDGSAAVWNRQPWKTQRQDRARELFESVAADGRLERAELQRMALDVQDHWSRWNWPRMQALLSDKEVLSARATQFLAWIERFRLEGPDGKPDAEAFLAHPMSQVMPWMVLVRDRYEDALLEQRAPGAALELAFDPLRAGTTAEAFLGEERYAPNRDALRAALEWTAELREKTLAGEPGGLVNAAWLRALPARNGDTAALFPEPWSNPLYRAQAPGWGPDAPPVGLRWGMVNVYALTPHRATFEPPRANTGLVQAWLDSFFAPGAVEPPLPHYRRQPTVVFPTGGTYASLFQVHRSGARSSAKALLEQDEGWLHLQPADFGSQALFLAELVPGERPRVSVLTALGASELLLGLSEGGLDSLDLYRPTRRFAAGQWSELTTDEASLRARPGVRRLELAE